MNLAQRAQSSMFGLAHHAHGYQAFANRFATRLYQRITTDVVAAGLPLNGRILDVGTGPGLLALRIAAARPDLRIDAVDLSEQMIEQARRGALEAGRESQLSFVLGDVAALPYPEGSFDLVVSSISQHHWTDPVAGVRDITRVLRPGAQAWIYDFRWSLGRARRALPDGSRLDTSRFSPIGRLVWRRPSQSS